jgi:hypothetical protein
MSEPAGQPNLQDVTKDASGTSSDEDAELAPEEKEGLPPDLVPGEDNPLAQGLPDGETVDGMLEEGKQAEKTVYDEDGDEVVERSTTGTDSDEDEDEDSGEAG